MIQLPIGLDYNDMMDDYRASEHHSYYSTITPQLLSACFIAQCTKGKYQLGQCNPKNSKHFNYKSNKTPVDKRGEKECRKKQKEENGTKWTQLVL